MTVNPEEIPGWLTPAEGAQLQLFAEGVKPGKCIIELGAYKGKSTVYLARGARPEVDILVFDTFNSDAVHVTKEDTYNEFMKNVESFPNVTPFRTTTDKGVDTCLELKCFDCQLLFIDADHSYEQVKKDIKNYLPFVEVGGYIIMHDVYDLFGNRDKTHYEGVRKAFDELLATGTVEEIAYVHRQSVLKKIK